MPPRVKKLVCVTCGFRSEAIRSIGRFVFGKHGKANVLLLPTGLPRALSRVVDSDLDTDNRACAMNCLGNIAIFCGSLVLVDNEIIACALRVVQEQGTGAAPFSPPPLPSSCCVFLGRIHLFTFVFASIQK
jgi:hypothetical protein